MASAKGKPVHHTKLALLCSAALVLGAWLCAGASTVSLASDLPPPSLPPLGSAHVEASSPQQVAPVAPLCCWSAWGNKTTACGSYPITPPGPGACNTDWATTCTSDGDCTTPPGPTPPGPTPPGSTPPGPTPPGPTPTAPPSVIGQFNIATWNGVCTVPYGINTRTYGACPAWETSEETICFGGASDITFLQETLCFPDGTGYVKARATAEKIWFAIGGGDPDPNQYWSKEALSKLNDKINDGTLSPKSYTGIFYDVEVLYDVDYSDFATSFALAKSKGLRVMVGTSHSAPYDCRASHPSCASYPVQFPAGTDAIWKMILKDENIDILSPQLYGTGVIGAGQISLAHTSGSTVNWKTWKELVPEQTKIISMLKVHISFGVSYDESFDAALELLHDGCKNRGFDGLNFDSCDDWSVYVWTSS